jgi:hypothetical protein
MHELLDKSLVCSLCATGLPDEPKKLTTQTWHPVSLCGKLCYHSKNCYHTRFHDLILSGAGLSPTSQFRVSTVVVTDHGKIKI